ncbi:MAG: iron-containing alcohol dehydrogenase [Deltaproteobacteria bacterium]|nr:iron-containing alcohol dehydrogenase [Deltaproteobacteria bacterium]
MIRRITICSHLGKLLPQCNGNNNVPDSTLPRPYLIAVPTTSGTGSEVSRGAVITDTRTNTKSVIRTGPSSQAVIDPEMTLTMPPSLTARAGMDALCHHIEARVSNRVLDHLRISPASCRFFNAKNVDKKIYICYLTIRLPYK